MSLFSESNWISLFLCGAVAIVISWATSGCRIGNHIENPTPPPNPDQTSGFYLTQPQQLTFYVTTTQTQQSSAPISFLPAGISNTMSNPVALVMIDLAAGVAVIATNQGKNPLPVSVGTDLSLSGTWSTAPQTYWLDSQCQSYLEITETGSVTQSSSLSPPEGFDQPVSGTLQIHFQVVTKFEGNCVPTFQALANCLQDANQCGGSSASDNLTLQDDVASTLNPFLQLKLITPSDIPNIQNYAYEVSYQ